MASECGHVCCLLLAIVFIIGSIVCCGLGRLLTCKTESNGYSNVGTTDDYKFDLSRWDDLKEMDDRYVSRFVSFGCQCLAMMLMIGAACHTGMEGRKCLLMISLLLVCVCGGLEGWAASCFGESKRFFGDVMESELREVADAQNIVDADAKALAKQLIDQSVKLIREGLNSGGSINCYVITWICSAALCFGCLICGCCAMCSAHSMGQQPNHRRTGHGMGPGAPPPPSQTIYPAKQPSHTLQQQPQQQFRQQPQYNQQPQQHFQRQPSFSQSPRTHGQMAQQAPPQNQGTWNVGLPAPQLSPRQLQTH